MRLQKQFTFRLTNWFHHIGSKLTMSVTPIKNRLIAAFGTHAVKKLLALSEASKTRPKVSPPGGVGPPPQHLASSDGGSMMYRV